MRINAPKRTINVIRLVPAAYHADAARAYLHGQNPSGSGALYLASKYSDMFAAVVISSGPIVYDTYPFATIKGRMGLLVIHGDQDTPRGGLVVQKLSDKTRGDAASSKIAS